MHSCLPAFKCDLAVVAKPSTSHVAEIDRSQEIEGQKALKSIITLSIEAIETDYVVRLPLESEPRASLS